MAAITITSIQLIVCMCRTHPLALLLFHLLCHKKRCSATHLFNNNCSTNVNKIEWQLNITIDFYSILDLLNCCSLKIAHWEWTHKNKTTTRKSVDSKECCIKNLWRRQQRTTLPKIRFMLFSIVEFIEWFCYNQQNIRKFVPIQSTEEKKNANGRKKSRFLLLIMLSEHFFKDCNTTHRTVVPVSIHDCPVNTPHVFCRHHTHLHT